MTPQDITTAAADQQADIIRAYWLERNPNSILAWHSEEHGQLIMWTEQYKKFDAMIACGAHLSAVEMMVPKGHVFTVSDWWMDGDERPPHFADCARKTDLLSGDECSVVQAWANTKALALLAAIAQVEEQDDA